MSQASFPQRWERSLSRCLLKVRIAISGPTVNTLMNAHRMPGILRKAHVKKIMHTKLI